MRVSALPWITCNRLIVLYCEEDERDNTPVKTKYPLLQLSCSTLSNIQPSTHIKRQNLEVQIAFPVGILAKLVGTPSPLCLWIIIDGYLTRDVQ